MKKTIYTIAIAIAALCASSCEGFLTKVPETQLSPESFFRTEAELRLFTNSFYSTILPDPASASAAEQVADDHISTSLSAIQKGTRLPSSKWWSGSFDVLRKINYFLENNTRCEDLAVREKYNGVAYFFRAYFYYEMVRQFGDMPYYDRVIGSADTELLNKPRDNRSYVMYMVLKDLDKAAERLPEAWGAEDPYRVTKDAALALKSRVALFEGTFLKYHAGSEYVKETPTVEGETLTSEWFLQQAASAAEQVIGKHSLYKGNTMKLEKSGAPYREFFILEDADKSENILAIRYNAAIPVRHGIQFDYKNARHSATQRFVNHYLLSNGQSITTKANWQNLDYKETFTGRDPRLTQTLQGPTYVAAAETAHEVLSWERTLTGYRIIKFISDSSHEGATTSATDWPVIRYAEVLLNYAEARAELGILSADDVARTIDVIRDRVGMKKMSTVPSETDALMQEYYPNAKGSQLAAILEVRRERTIELFSEGFRQWDLIRWAEGKWMCPAANQGYQGIYIGTVGEFDLDGDGAKDVLFYNKGAKPATIDKAIAATAQIEIGGNFTLKDGRLTYFAAEKYAWDDKCDYLWPIPADQRTATHGALTQNPGWDDGLSF